MSGHRHELDFIRALASVMGEYELHKVSYHAGDTSVTLERSGLPRSFGAKKENPIEPVAVTEMRTEKMGISLQTIKPELSSPIFSTSEPVSAVSQAGIEEAPRPQGQAIKSPMVGTVYLAPAPNAAPYVAVGDTVTQGQVLCIIEAMKIMNPFKSPVSGKVQAIVVQDAQAVEYDEVLLWIA